MGRDTTQVERHASSKPLSVATHGRSLQVLRGTANHLAIGDGKTKPTDLGRPQLPTAARARRTGRPETTVLPFVFLPSTLRTERGSFLRCLRTDIFSQEHLSVEAECISPGTALETRPAIGHCRIGSALGKHSADGGQPSGIHSTDSIGRIQTVLVPLQHPSTTGRCAIGEP